MPALDVESLPLQATTMLTDYIAKPPHLTAQEAFQMPPVPIHGVYRVLPFYIHF